MSASARGSGGGDGQTSTAMDFAAKASFVDECRGTYATLRAEARALIEGPFRRECAVCWILDSNRLERCGTQDMGSTRAALLSELRGRTIPEAETVNTLRALDLLFTHLAEKNADVASTSGPEFGQLDLLLLSVDSIVELHGTVIALEADRAGEFRTGNAHPGDLPLFLYTSPERIEAELYEAIDSHNDAIRTLAESCEGEDPASSSLMIIAARLLHSVLRVHPFGDGNGRIARLLVTATLHLYHPVAVAIPITGEADRL